MLEPTKTRYPMSKDKEEATARQYEGAIFIKINSHTHQVGHRKLENNNTKEVLPLL